MMPINPTPSVATLHAALCALMTQFIHHRCAFIAHSIAGYLRRIAEHPDRHLLGACTNVYRDLAYQWDNVSKKLLAGELPQTVQAIH